MSEQPCSSNDDRNVIQHSKTGTYSLDELVPKDAQSLTLEQILVLVVSKIVNHPEDIEVTVVNSGRIKLIEFDVHPEDRGLVLGRQGYIIHALRTLEKAIRGPMVKRYSYRIDLAHDDKIRDQPIE